MPYQEDSLEANFGHRCEQAVDIWTRKQGWWRLQVSDLGHAAFLRGPENKLIALDRLYIQHGISRWCDIKGKTGPVHFQILDVMRHGIDKPNWEHYLKVEEKTGIAGDIGIVELKRHRGDKAIDPVLLWASLAHLRSNICDGIGNNSGKMVYWNVEVFTRLGPIDVGDEPISPTRQILNPWERPDYLGRLRLPPLAPKQGNLFDYNANKDFSESINECYKDIRKRKAEGGKDWP